MSSWYDPGGQPHRRRQKHNPRCEGSPSGNCEGSCVERRVLRLSFGREFRTHQRLCEKHYEVALREARERQKARD